MSIGGNWVHAIRVARYGVLAAVLMGSGIHAQSVSFGVKGGVPLTSAVESNGRVPGAKRYTVGPMIEIALPFSFAFEGDALYRRTGYNVISGHLGTTTDTHLRANSWEFPLLAKYYFGPRRVPVRFYAAGSYVLRHVSGLDISIHSYRTEFLTRRPFDATFHTLDTRAHAQHNHYNELHV